MASGGAVASTRLTEENDGKYLNSMLKVKYEKTKENDVKRPTVLQKIFCRRNQPNSKYYFTIAPGEDKKEHRDVFKEVTPYWFPDTEKNDVFIAYSKARRKADRRLDLYKNYNEKDNYRTRQFKDVRSRMYVPEPVDDVKTIVDVDPEFYSLVEGRPIAYRFSKSDFAKVIRDCAVYNLQAGFQEDEILLLNKSFHDEEEIFSDVCTQYNNYVKSFEDFLAEDYEKSMAMLKRSEEMSAKLNKKKEEYLEVSLELGLMTKKVYVLEEKCRHSKIYQDFLYKVAPLSWYNENIAVHEENNNMINLSDSFEGSKEIVSRQETNSVGPSVTSLESLIEIFKINLQRSQEPQLYFTEPWQMAYMIRGIIMQNLRSWANAEKLTENVERFHEKLKTAEQLMQKEYNELKETINDITIAIEEEEARAESLKQRVLKIIATSFYETIASEYAMRLHLFIQDIYENLIFRDIKFTTYKMMKTLELEYENLMLNLDHLNIDSVRAAQKEVYELDVKTMKEAKEAAKQLKNLEKISRHLKKTLEPPFQKVGKPVMYSTLKQKGKKEEKTKARAIIL